MPFPHPYRSYPWTLVQSTKLTSSQPSRGPGSTTVLAILFVVMAIAEQRSIEAFCNELHILFHAEASNPGGPALPSVCITASNEAQNDAEKGRLAKSVQFENKEEQQRTWFFPAQGSLPRCHCIEVWVATNMNTQCVCMWKGKWSRACSELLQGWTRHQTSRD